MKGFEEEFDRVVPCDRAGYADRDLLCEPVFSYSAHLRLAEVFIGEKSWDDLVEESGGDDNPTVQ